MRLSQKGIFNNFTPVRMHCRGDEIVSSGLLRQPQPVALVMFVAQRRMKAESLIINSTGHRPVLGVDERVDYKSAPTA